MSGLTPDLLAEHPLFGALSQQQCADVLQRQLISCHAAGQTVVLENDCAESLFVLLSGLAKVRSFTCEGEEVVLSILGSGDVFGEMALLDDNPRSADVVALTAVEVVKLRSAPVTALLLQNAAMANALAKLQIHRLRELNQRFAAQSCDATTRMLAALAYLARRCSASGDLGATIPAIPQRELALLAGLARETASRTLSKLRQRGTLQDEQGSLRLLDLQALVQRGLISPAEAQR